MEHTPPRAIEAFLSVPQAAKVLNWPARSLRSELNTLEDSLPFYAAYKRPSGRWCVRPFKFLEARNDILRDQAPAEKTDEEAHNEFLAMAQPPREGVTI